jgi:uncharacterized membrane protein YgcG
MLRALRVLSALLLFAATSAHAQERILRFLSDVQIQKDSSLEVTETIDVNVENVAINHGIFRDFPTRYRDPRGGGQIRVGFTFEGATLDGMPVPASTSAQGNGIRIKVGDPDQTIAPGEHSFVLHFRTTRQIARFKDYEELYWNATGNGWQFPIDLAEARLHLPVLASFGQRAFYTGPQGSTASNAEVIDERPGEIAVRTTTPLGPYEGLTVAAAFPKGVVAEAAAGSRLGWWVADYGPPALGLLVLLGLYGFYYVAWLRAGRDPRAGTVVPIFAPPDELTPAGMRYVTQMSSDNRAFAAALVDMGVRGHIRMVEEDEGWFSSKKTRIERVAAATELPSEEKAALDELCLPGESILMEQKNHASFSSANNSLSKILKARYDGKLFKRNYGWAAAGLLLFLAGLWLTAASLVVATSGTNLVQAGVVFGGFLVVALLWLAFHDSAVGKCLLSLVSLAGFAVAASVGLPMIVEALNTGWWLPLVLPALAAPLVLSAFWWISAPTPEGRTVLDHIAGFKQYLSITETERLDRMTPPKDTPEVFERFLPYAIALGVENRWAARFASVLAAAAAHGQQGFVWYSGSSNPWDNPTGFTHDVGSSLASTISSASAAPGSSSGSGGGGSSGGGGGGGGGGGW